MGKPNGECAAFSRLTLYRDTAAMGMDDLRADGEPNAGPLPIRLGGKKRVKILLWYSSAIPGRCHGWRRATYRMQGALDRSRPLSPASSTAVCVQLTAG